MRDNQQNWGVLGTIDTTEDQAEERVVKDTDEDVEVDAEALAKIPHIKLRGRLMTKTGWDSDVAIRAICAISYRMRS